MYPFEVWSEEQIVDFHWDTFSTFEDELFRQYPPNHVHHRVRVSLIFPSDRLEDVWVHGWNPHHEIGNHHLNVYNCFYDSDRWSTIFEVYPAHITTGQESWICFIEEDHADPWGEPIRLMSTADVIYNNTAHRYAYFRGKYWKVLSFIPCWPTVNWTLGSVDVTNLFHEEETTVGRIQWTILGDLQPPGKETPKHDWMKEGF